MKIPCFIRVACLIYLSALLLFTLPVGAFAAAADVPVKGMVTIIDLGAKKCIPCKMMAPILEKLKKVYAGRAAVVFLDVWEDPKPAQRFGIRGIPTQIFLTKRAARFFGTWGS